MADAKKTTLGEQLNGLTGGILGKPKRRTYKQIVATFVTTKRELEELVKERDFHVAGLETKISTLEQEKLDAIAEKGSAVGTLEFLNKLVAA